MTEPNPSDPARQPDPPLRVRYRVRFAKRDLLRWISHRDLARLWERLVRRARLPLSMTEGFHPKPRIAFPSALALGVESLDEVVELELTEMLSAGQLLRVLDADEQPGLEIHSVHRLPPGFGKAQLERSDYTISLVDGVHREDVERAIGSLLETETVSVERKKKTVVVHIPSQLPALELADDHLRLSLAASDGASLRPADVLDLLGFADWIERGARLIRTRVVLKSEFQSADASEAAHRTVSPNDAANPNDRHTDVSVQVREAP